MALPGTLLPILHDADWSGTSLAACRALVSGDATYIPLVAFTEDTPERRSTWTVAALDDSNRTLESLESEAVANLDQRAIEFQPRPDGTFIAIDEYASSLLISPRGLERARSLVGGAALLLAAPTRGLLVVVPRPDNGDAGLSRFARESFAGALEARISPHVFAWDGESLELHHQVVPNIAPGRWESQSYDEAEELLTLELVGELGPAAVAAISRTLARGAYVDGRVVAELVLVVDSNDACEALTRQFGRDDVRVVRAGGTLREDHS